MSQEPWSPKNKRIPSGIERWNYSNSCDCWCIGVWRVNVTRMCRYAMSCTAMPCNTHAELMRCCRCYERRRESRSCVYFCNVFNLYYFWWNKQQFRDGPQWRNCRSTSNCIPDPANAFMAQKSICITLHSMTLSWSSSSPSESPISLILQSIFKWRTGKYGATSRPRRDERFA